MSKIYFYPDIDYHDIKNIEKNHTIDDEKFLINEAVSLISKRLLKLVNKTERLLFVCGPGNNGLDAFYAAKKLISENYNVDVFVTDQFKKSLKNNDYDNCNIIDNLNNLSNYNYIIDGIFGYGLNRKLEEKYIKLINLINNSSSYVVSIDIPSGLNHQTGTPMPVSIECNVLISLLTIKRGLFTNCGRDTWMKILHHNLVDYDCSSNNYLITANSEILSDSAKYKSRKLYQKELHSQHKKSNGISCIVAGQKPYHGALILSAKSSIETGTKYIHVYTEAEYSSTLPLLIPEIITNSYSIKTFSKAITSYKQILIGPGTTSIGKDYVNVALENINCCKSIIIDAGALKYIDKNKSYSDKLIITPHPGEAAQLLNIDVSDVQNDRYAAAQKLHDIYECIVILKGSGTIIYDGKSFYTCMDGNYRMASAGTGDVLSGIILSETSLQNDNIDACIKSVTYHSYSSDIICNEQKNKNFRPSMIPDKYSELSAL